MHFCFRTRADSLVFSALEPPWSEKRGIRRLGPGDLNIRDHISYPILCTPQEHDFGRDVDEVYAPTPVVSRTPSETDSIEKYLGHLDSKVSTQSLRPSPVTEQRSVRPSTLNRSGYSFFPHRDSSTFVASTPSTIPPSTEKVELNLPLPPAPLFSQKHTRVSSARSTSSATVQIGLRLSHLGQTLDPFEKGSLSLRKGEADLSTESPAPNSGLPAIIPQPSQREMESQQKDFVIPHQTYMPLRQTMKPQQIDIRPPFKGPDVSAPTLQNKNPEASESVPQRAQSAVPMSTRSPYLHSSRNVPEWRPPVWRPKTIHQQNSLTPSLS